MEVRAPILEAVRGGESALAMAKRRYDTVHLPPAGFIQNAVLQK